jgi:hypothetical protein
MVGGMGGFLLRRTSHFFFFEGMERRIDIED